MTKSQLIEKAAKDNDLTKKEVAQVLDALIGAAEEALVAGDAIQLTGFGTFAAKQRSAHNGRNPKTGEVVEIPASRTASFAPSKVLKDKLNNEA